MLRIFNFMTSPFLVCMAVSTFMLLPASEAARASEGEREISSWNIAYDGGWVDGEEDGLIPRGAVNSVMMRRNDENYDVFFHYTLCHMCAALDRQTSYFSVDEEKAQQIAALVDANQIEAALERPCTLPSARASLARVSVTLLPPPAGYAPSSYDILLGCRSPEVDEVKANLDAAIRLFSVWMVEHENQSKP